MSALDLEAFQETFRAARSMAVVGNAESVLQWQSGQLIDEHDVVVRFNRAYTEGIEDRVGRRTDVLVANRTYSLRKAPSPAATLKPKCVVCFLEPEREIDYAAFNEWTGGLPTLITLAPDLAPLGQFRRTRPVTMGTNALYTLLRLFRIERLFLTGFTFYGAAAGSQGVYCGTPRKARGLWHDLDDEAAIFARVVGGHQGELRTTPEVADLLRRYGAGGCTEPDRGTVPTVDHLYARLGWRLIRWGTRLRQRAERSGQLAFSGPKRKNRAEARSA